MFAKTALRTDATLADGDFGARLEAESLGPLERGPTTTLQLNLGRRCNQSCAHCHVDAGPGRSESMSEEVAARVLALLDASTAVTTVDLTGGAPELHPTFRRLVVEARSRGLEVIDRSNLTILQQPGQEDLASFLAEQRVRVVASLPCYTAANVDRQRGAGAFDGSVAGLRALNELGFGVPGTGLPLDLVYNPGGAFLPGPQAALEADYRERLLEDVGVRFTRLLTLANMPLRRFASWLQREGLTDRYWALLTESFNRATVAGLMCRSLVSVGWDGRTYDCDFNQVLGIGLAGPRTVFDLGSLDDLEGRPIRTDRHCFGCTAGTGSSCGGALT